MFLGLIRRRVEWKTAIAADARRLIEKFNELAYFEAPERVRGRCVDERAEPAIGLPSSSKSPGAKGLRLALPAPMHGPDLRRGR